MSSLATLARPYAKAAFELAHQQGDLPGWSDALSAASLVVTDDAMAEWLQSPDLDRSQAVDVIGTAAGRGETDIFRRFLSVLADNNRLALMPQVAHLFDGLRQEAENRLQVRVVSAIPLESDQAERMRAALAARFNCEIELENEVDAGVMGGAVIYAGDQVIDGSLVGRLKNLENSLV